jgi:hypothetical protein
VGTVDVAAVYGIKADGVTDNYPALQKLNSDWRGPDKCYVEFLFPAGQVNYSKSFWLDGIDSFKARTQTLLIRQMMPMIWAIAR